LRTPFTESDPQRALRSKPGVGRRGRRPACEKSRFFPRFVSFQGFAGRKISLGRDARSRVSSALRLTIGGNDVSHRPAPDSRAPMLAVNLAGSSPPSERCRRGSCADSETREVKSGQVEDPSTCSLFQKENSTKKCDRCHHGFRDPLGLSQLAKRPILIFSLYVDAQGGAPFATWFHDLNVKVRPLERESASQDHVGAGPPETWRRRECGRGGRKRMELKLGLGTA
jgi:hypothetical protein